MAPSVVRYALRLPDGAELRFTPRLHSAARAAGASAALRVTLETRAGEEKELWSRVVDARAAADDREVSVAAAGRAGGRRAPGPPRRRGTGRAVRLGRLDRAARAGPGRRAGEPARSTARGRDGRARARTRSAGRSAGRERPADRPRRRAREELRRRTAMRGPRRPRWTGSPPKASSSSGPTRRPSTRWARCRRCGPRSIPTCTTPRSPTPTGCPPTASRSLRPCPRAGVHTAGFVANPMAGRLFGFERGFARVRRGPRAFPRPGQPRGGVPRACCPRGCARTPGAGSSRTCTSASRTFPTTPARRSTRGSAPTRPLTRAQRRDKCLVHRREPAAASSRPPDEIAHLVRLYDGNLASVDQRGGRAARARSSRRGSGTRRW